MKDKTAEKCGSDDVAILVRRLRGTTITVRFPRFLAPPVDVQPLAP